MVDAEMAVEIADIACLPELLDTMGQGVVLGNRAEPSQRHLAGKDRLFAVMWRQGLGPMFIVGLSTRISDRRSYREDASRTDSPQP